MDIIVEVRHKGKTISVEKRIIAVSMDGEIVEYDVLVDSTVKHPSCEPEAVMRALAHYLHDNS